jgi:hypothetical protein
LTEKGYVDPTALDRIVENVETASAPPIGGQRLVAITGSLRSNADDAASRLMAAIILSW